MPRQKFPHLRSVVTDRRLKFAVVGVANTATDFIVLNILAYFFGVPALVANIFSSGCAMAQSFVLNKKIVFKSRGGNRIQQGVLFLIVTLLGVWGVQSVIIWLFHVPFEWTAQQLVASPELATLLALNAVKALATIASMAWNYIFYRSLVFKKANV